MRPVRGLARVLLGGLFIAAGSQAVLNPDRYALTAAPVAQRVGPLLRRFDSRLPGETRQLVRATAAVQVAAGVMLASGNAPRSAAAVLAGTMLPAAVLGHPFWRAATASERRAEQVQFAKNLGLLGGLLLAAVDTAGAPSLRWRAGHAVRGARRSLNKVGRKAGKEPA